MPDGTVRFSAQGEGTFDETICTLAPDGEAAEATCSVNYTPTALGIGHHFITAKYGGSASHQAQTGQVFDVRVGPTATGVVRTKSMVLVGESTHCVATVADSAGGTTQATGSVTFHSDGEGTFGSSS